MTTVDHFCAQLRERGRRVTPQRRAIIQVLLEKAGTHPTAESVLVGVQSLMSEVSPATVYNTLHELEELGMLLELDLGPRERHYDLTTKDHAHLVCLGCGRVKDAPYDCEALTIPAQQIHGFQVTDRRVTLRGYCPACALLQRSSGGIHTATGGGRVQSIRGVKVSGVS